MDLVAGLIGLLTGAFLVGLATWRYAAREMSRVQARLEERVSFWQGETERARTSAAQVTERTAAWVAGCEQGREEVLSLARALAAQEPTGPGPMLAGRFVPGTHEEEDTSPATTARSA